MTEVLTYEALKAERDALAVENTALKYAITTHSQSTHFCELCGKDDPCSTDDVCYALKETPATDAALAAIRLEAKIEGANELAERIAEMHSKTAPGSNIEKKLMFAAEAAIAYANGLREAK